jgi:hypothetical protein
MKNITCSNDTGQLFFTKYKPSLDDINIPSEKLFRLLLFL